MTSRGTSAPSCLEHVETSAFGHLHVEEYQVRLRLADDLIASDPRPHSSTDPMSGSRPSRTVRLRLASGSSSTTRVLDRARFGGKHGLTPRQPGGVTTTSTPSAPTRCKLQLGRRRREGSADACAGWPGRRRRRSFANRPERPDRRCRRSGRGAVPARALHADASASYRLATPCLMAFSTSGCSSRLGTARPTGRPGSPR